MCGRYHIGLEGRTDEMRRILEELNRKYCGTDQLAEMKTGEVFPTNTVPVLCVDGPELMKWGFPLHDGSRVIINARSETAREKPMFAASLRERRVAVPTSGFYEWTHEGKKSVDKYLFGLPGEEMLYLAGLYTEFNLAGRREARFSILTTVANDSMRPFHDRMPVYLAPRECDRWIRDGKFTEEALHRPQPELRATLVPKKPDQEQMSLF